MSPTFYVLVDAGLSFGVVIAICVHQLISTDRARKRRIEREQEQKRAKDDAG